ncbi:MAG: hypothetical protein EB078_12475, partial [Proteobacteria bacterium]|nr:hypothetical protein [Pseudomonadota bacterium]
LINNFNGAVTRIRSLAEQLAHQGAQVTVWSLISPRISPLESQELVPRCSHYESRNQIQWLDGLSSHLGFPAYSLTSSLNAFLPLPSPLKESFDIVISESPFLWQVAKRVRSKVKVLSAHNHEATYHGGFPPRAVALLKRNEERAIHEADLVVCVSEEDKLTFEKVRPGRLIQSLPNGFYNASTGHLNLGASTPNLKKKWGIADNHRIALYLASNSSHNQRGMEALTHLFSHPEIKIRWSLLVVGNIQLSEPLPENIISCGVQTQLFPFFEGSDVALNPVCSGSGSNVKLIECLGNGLSVLTTPFGARGFKQHLKGLHISPLDLFQNRLIDQEKWTRPDPNELASYEWKQLGNQLFELLSASLRGEGPIL